MGEQAIQTLGAAAATVPSLRKVLPPLPLVIPCVILSVTWTLLSHPE